MRPKQNYTTLIFIRLILYTGFFANCKFKSHFNWNALINIGTEMHNYILISLVKKEWSFVWNHWKCRHTNVVSSLMYERSGIVKKLSSFRHAKRATSYFEPWCAHIDCHQYQRQICVCLNVFVSVLDGVRAVGWMLERSSMQTTIDFSYLNPFSLVNVCVCIHVRADERTTDCVTMLCCCGCICVHVQRIFNIGGHILRYFLFIRLSRSLSMCTPFTDSGIYGRPYSVACAYRAPPHSVLSLGSWCMLSVLFLVTLTFFWFQCYFYPPIHNNFSVRG